MTPWLVAIAPSSDFVLRKLEGNTSLGQIEPAHAN
jgi:hypothetical protein